MQAQTSIFQISTFSTVNICLVNIFPVKYVDVQRSKFKQVDFELFNFVLLVCNTRVDGGWCIYE